MSRITNKSIDSTINNLNLAIGIDNAVCLHTGSVIGAYTYDHTDSGYRLTQYTSNCYDVVTIFDFWFTTSEFYYIVLAYRAGLLKKNTNLD